MKTIQIIPVENFNMKKALKEKERDLRKKGKGTFYRVDEGKWHHSSYWGWVWFQQGWGNILNVVIQSKKTDQEWQLLTAFIGFIERHFSKYISAVNIQYR